MTQLMAAKVHPAEENTQPSCNGSTISLCPNGGGGIRSYSDIKNLAPKDKPGSDRCGLGLFARLRPLQCFAKVEWFVVFLCIFCFVEGASVNGFISISLTTIEKRFNFQSSESGFIISSTDIGAIVFVLFVSYYGDKGHKPRVIGMGCLLMALGSFLVFLPHILVGKYEYSSDVNNIGHVCDSNRTDPCSDGSNDGSGSSTYLALFSLGQALQGIGFTPAFTVGAAYVDENTTPDKTAMFMGLIYALTALGVAAGFMVGGQLLNVWVDVGRVDPDSIPIDPSDRRWLGAWWIGFTITAGLYTVLAPPLASFPTQMPGTLTIPNDSFPKDGQNKMDSDSLWQRILSFPKAIYELVRDSVFVMVVLVGSVESLLITGLGAFSAKLLEDKFDVPSDDAGLVMGAVTVVGGAGGMFLGGFLIRKYHLTVQSIIKLCLLMVVSALLLGAGFFINCPESKFAGLTAEYKRASNDSKHYELLMSGCNAGCGCLTDEFDPVCGSDDVIYFSPCHAGCDDNVIINGLKKTYTNCSCVTATVSSSSSVATNGQCPNDCPNLWLFVVILFLALLATFTTVTPLSIVIMRRVPEDKRSLGLGVQWQCLRLLGTIPGPVLTGFVLDKSCDLWQTTCQGQGNCWVYDRYTMSWSLFSWWTGVKMFSFVMLTIVLFITHREDGKRKIDTATAHVMNGSTQRAATPTQ